MALLRDTKARAKRIDLTYFRRPHPFRRWKRILCILAPAAAAAWIAAVAARGDDRLYNSGPLAPRHAMLEKNCGACHTTGWAGRYTDPAGWQAALDVACLKCHDGPVHHANAVGDIRGPRGAESAANCSRCHVEHAGTSKLAAVHDRQCVSCHADLKTTGPASAFERRITSFSLGHPEFGLLARKAKDPAVVAFNHAVHLNPDTAAKRELLAGQLKGLAGRLGIEGDSLGCAYCHRPSGTGAYLAPIHYESHCMDCHGLKLEKERVPHEDAVAVRDFLRSRLARGGKGGEALAELVAEAEIPLYTSDPDGCMKCHKTDLGTEFPATPPVVARTGLRTGAPDREESPRRWFLHSTFDHGTHRTLRCLECHAGAAESKATADVLLPARAACLRCHSEAGGVSSTCTTCHSYHDKTRVRPQAGRLGIGDVVK